MASPTLEPPPTAPPSLSSTPEVDGLLVFYIATSEGFELFTMRPDGRDRQQITHIDGDAIAPEWAPDGSRVAFEVDANEECNVAFVDPDGSNLAVIPRQDSTCEGQPSFTPDGTRVVFNRTAPDSGDDGIWSMKLDGTDRREVGPGFGAAWSPAVSPDGLTVSAAGWNLLEGDAQYEGIFTMGLNGSNPRWVTPFWNPFHQHAWSPDGEWIAVSDNLEDRTLPANVVLVRPDGSSASDPVFLTQYERADQRAAVASYSPDGDWILFRLREGDLWALYRIRPDRSDLEQMTAPSTFAPLEIDWGPDANS